MLSPWIPTLLLSSLTTFAYGHGSMQYPQSRIYLGYHDGVKTSPHAAIQAAIEVGGTQPFYDWNEVVNFVPGDAAAQHNADYEALVPDGQIASGGNPKYAGLDLVRDDWPTTAVESGPFDFVWKTTTIHNPNIFNAWITSADWDPSMPLDWAHLEPLTLGPVEQLGSEYHFATSLPERVGVHSIFVIWQRIDPAGEGFYSLSDVDFGSHPADLNGDGAVDGGDLGVLLAAWNTPHGDIDGDAMTNGVDLGLLLSHWGT